MDTNKIYNIDALEGMKQLENNSVDLVLTDPPYGIGENNKKNLSRSASFGTDGEGEVIEAKDYGNFEWDQDRISLDFFKEMFRVSDNQIIFGGNYYLDFLEPTSCMIVWDKNNTGDFADCELAWTSFDTAVRKYKWTWNGMLQENMKDKEKRVHPTQKPVGLFKAILDDYSEPGDLILDPFIGSGTTGLAARALDRDFIGFEKNEDYVEVARERLSSVQKELIR